MSIPVFIISHNRYSFLKRLIDRLESVEGIDIVIVDNGSKYEPLLEYYKTLNHQIVYLENLGHFSPWTADLVPKTGFYAVTDPDVIPCDFVPNNFIRFFIDVLKFNSHLLKIGFGLRIDNLPDRYKFKDEVINWESKYWQNLYGIKDGVELFRAEIDTTFAVYNSGRFHTGYDESHLKQSLRTGHPYVAEHLPWYEESVSLEDKFYLENSNRSIVSWSSDSIADYLI